MTVLGVVLLLGVLLDIYVLTIVGIILIVVGVLLMVVPIGGRTRRYY